MSENNTIYEIAQLMSSRTNLQNDFAEAAQLINNLFKKKYIDKINYTIQNQRTNIQKNPSKEINLLNAFKPFLNSEYHSNIDSLINIFTDMNVIKNIQNEIYKNRKVSVSSLNSINDTEKNKYKNISIDSSIQKDGIYEIDQKCISNKQSEVNNDNNGIYPILLFMLFSSFM